MAAKKKDKLAIARTRLDKAIDLVERQTVCLKWVMDELCAVRTQLDQMVFEQEKTGATVSL